MRVGFRSVFAAAAVLLVEQAFAVTYSPLLPPSYPLAVRNPYLSAWMPGQQVSNIAASSPQFWAGQELTLGLMVRIGNATYSLMGIGDSPDGVTAATLQSAEYTTTHTVFKYSTGSTSVTLDFFSPVSPMDYVRQSLPFSYITVSTSGGSDAVSVYMDFDETWTGQNSSTSSDFSSTNGYYSYSLTANGQAKFSQNNDMALWGSAIFAAPSDDATHQTGASSDVRSAFVESGKLSNEDSQYEGGNVVAIASSVSSGSVTYAVGYDRDDAINFTGQSRTGYYKSKYPTVSDALKAFFEDYSSANSESKSLDQKLEKAATDAAGTNYSDITTLSVRQTFASIDLTIPTDTKDTNDLMIFLKEISSDGNVNTLDVLFPAFPIWYVMCPEYIRYSLEPVMKYLETGAWSQPFAIHDIGSSYPNATGHDDNNAEAQPVEESGNIIILAYIYSKVSGSTKWAAQYQNYLQKYADFLITQGIDMPAQLSTDDGAGPLANQTNLAIKAAIGLNAYGVMFDDKKYSDAGLNYSKQLYDDGLGTDENKTHFTLQYPNGNTTFTTAFNLYPDKLLDLKTFSQEAYDMQSAFYPSVRAQAGVPLDSRVDWAKSDWAQFSASYCSTSTRDMFIDDVWYFAQENQGSNQVPFSDKWFVSDSQGNPVGAYDGYRARPVVGGHFAELALKGADTVTV